MSFVCIGKPRLKKNVVVFGRNSQESFPHFLKVTVNNSLLILHRHTENVTINVDATRNEKYGFPPPPQEAPPPPILPPSFSSSHDDSDYDDVPAEDHITEEVWWHTFRKLGSQQNRSFYLKSRRAVTKSVGNKVST